MNKVNLEQIINECLALKKILGKDALPCKNLCNKYPSYYDKGKPRGCLIAHTALSLYELGRIWRRIKIIRNTLNEEDIVTVVLLHDIGKATQWYKSYQNRLPHHNAISAIYSWVTLTHKNENVKTIISFTIYMHHEAYIWKKKEISHLFFNFNEELGAFLRESKKRFESFLIQNQIFDTICKIIPYLPKLDENFLKLCTKITRKFYEKNREMCFENIYKAAESLKRKRFKIKGFLTISLPLLYLLYLADNRAARRRDDPNWEVRKHIKKDLISKTLVPV